MPMLEEDIWILHTILIFSLVVIDQNFYENKEISIKTKSINQENGVIVKDHEPSSN